MDQIIIRKSNKTQDMPQTQELQAILNRIGETKTYYQVDNIINSLLSAKNTASIHTLAKLEKQLEKLSPLTLTSSQWSSLRYALISLRTINASLKIPSFSDEE